MSVEDWVSGMLRERQRDRAKTQMTLGGLINALEGMPPDARVASLSAPHSYRGYYCDVAFEIADMDGKTQLVAELLGTVRSTVGKVFTGYKGGNYLMQADTPVWVANYGECGRKLMGLHEGGSVDLGSEDDT